MVVGVHMGLMKETNWCGPIMSPGHQISLKGKKGKDRATDTEDAPHFAAMEVNWLTIYLLNTLGWRFNFWKQRGSDGRQSNVYAGIMN